MSKYLVHHNKLEKWTVTVLFKSLSHAALNPEVLYSLRYDRGYKPKNRGATKPTRVQLGSVVWGHTATFLCSFVPKKTGVYDKKLLTLEVHQHSMAGRMGQSVGKDINIDLVKYLNTERELTFPIPVGKVEIGTLHLAIRARQTEVGPFSPSSGYDTEEGTDTHPRSGNSTVSALSDTAGFNSEDERLDRAESHPHPESGFFDRRVTMEVNGSMAHVIGSGVRTPSDSSFRSQRSRHSGHSESARAAYLEELHRRRVTTQPQRTVDESPNGHAAGRPAAHLAPGPSARRDSKDVSPYKPPSRDSNPHKVEELQYRVRELEAELRRKERLSSRGAKDDWEDQSRPSGAEPRVRKERDSRHSYRQAESSQGWNDSLSSASSRPRTWRDECAECVVS